MTYRRVFTPALRQSPDLDPTQLRGISDLCKTAPAGYGGGDPVLALSRRIFLHERVRAFEVIPEMDFAIHRAGRGDPIAGQCQLDEMNDRERKHFLSVFDRLHRHRVDGLRLTSQVAEMACAERGNYITLIYFRSFMAVIPTELESALASMSSIDLTVAPKPEIVSRICTLLVPAATSNHARIALPEALAAEWDALGQVLYAFAGAPHEDRWFRLDSSDAARKLAADPP